MKIIPCQFSIQFTGDTGFNSGRPKYKVICYTCNKVLHENTTGPIHYVNKHLIEVQEKDESS